MKLKDVQQLKHGLYKIYWKKKEGGGYSLASVGSMQNGDRWMAPCNWVSGSTEDMKIWKIVKSVEVIELR